MTQTTTFNGITITRDLQGRIIQESSSSSNFGIITTFDRTTTYDNRGNVSKRVTDRGLDGISSPGVTRISDSYTYDTRNNITKSVSLTESFFRYGPYRSQVTNTYTYDNLNHITKSISESDNNYDGKIDSISTISNTHNKQGKLISSVSKVDDNYDGKIDSISTISNTYNKQGKLISSVSKTTGLTYDSQDKLSGVTIVGKNPDNSDRLTNYKTATSNIGGKGNDLLLGNANADVLTGGGGSDIFGIGAKSGIDTISDFKKGTDLIGLTQAVSFGQLSFNKNQILLAGQTIATLTGVETCSLTAGDFISI